jgi:hypothetical protein
VTYRANMEAAFDEWFAAYQQRSWDASRIASDPVKPRPNWGTGFKSSLRDGWMGATLWCLLCKREHEGPCLTYSQSDAAGWCVSSKLAHMGKHSQNVDCVQWRVSQSDAATK